MGAVGQFEKRVFALVTGSDAARRVEHFTSGAQSVEEQLGRRQRVGNRQFDATHDRAKWMHFRTRLLQTFLMEGGEGAWNMGENLL